MTLSVRALTTYATVKTELGALVPDDSKRPQIERMINAASAAIVRAAYGREFYFDPKIVENANGMGGFRLILRRRPVKTVYSINLLNPDSTVAFAFDPTTFALDRDGRTGIIYRTSGAYGLTTGYSVGAANVWGRQMGWPWLAQPGDDLRGSPQANTERPAMQVTYSAGFVTPQQDLVKGPDGITPVDGVTAVGQRDLPEDLEEACIITVESLMARRGRTRDVQSETTQAMQTTWRQPTPGAGILPAEAYEIVQHYREVV